VPISGFSFSVFFGLGLNKSNAAALVVSGFVWKSTENCRNSGGSCMDHNKNRQVLILQGFGGFPF